jgi:hypothetical protein
VLGRIILIEAKGASEKQNSNVNMFRGVTSTFESSNLHMQDSLEREYNEDACDPALE